MKNAELILSTLEAERNGHDDGCLTSTGHGVFVGWDGGFEYYTDLQGQTTMTREEALARIAAAIGETYDPAPDSPVKEVRYIDVTPTWSAILPVLLFGLDAGTPEGRKIAREELARMARAADAYNASQPKDMTPEQVGEALKKESEQLAQDGHYGASEALISFARQATPAELTRFRDLIRATE